MVKVLQRTILWHLVFWGFVINYVLFINLNITIVQMVAPKDAQERKLNALIESELSLMSLQTTPVPEIYIEPNISNTKIATLQQNNSTNVTEKFSFEKYFLNHANLKYDFDGFHWNEYQQGLILSSFYWLHWLTQLPGGILAKKYGTKAVFGLSNVIGCWLCFFVPIAAYFSFKLLIVLRVIQGLIVGFTWPAMHVLTAKWIPPNERSKFVTAYYGSAVGVVVSYPLFAYVMHYYSWEWVYYISAVLGTIWWLGWLLLVFDTPAQNPRITETELRYIEKSLGSTVQTSEIKNTPWKAIFTSRPVWVNVIGQFGGVWGIFTLMTQSPTYFKVIHSWDIRATGILSGLPHILRMTFAYSFSLYVDYLLRSNKMSRTNVRKLATSISCIVSGIFVLALAYFGRNPIFAIIFVNLATIFQGAGSSGPLSSMIDIAPNFAGIISGISLTIAILPGFISAYLVGILTLNNQTFEAWTNVYLICTGILFISGFIYICFADSTLQQWNGHAAVKDDKNLRLLENNVEKPLKENNHVQ